MRETPQAPSGAGAFLEDERTRVLLENLQDILVLLDERANIRYESPAMERVLGIKPESRLGRSAFEFVHPDDLPAVRAIAEKHLQQPGPFPPFSMRFRLPDGSLRFLEARGSNLLANPAIGGVVVVLRDVTERETSRLELARAAEAAEREKAKLDAILSALGDGVSIQDAEYRVLYQNEAHRRLIGDQVGRFCFSAYECRETVCEGCPVALAFADGAPHTVSRSAPSSRGMLEVEITASCVRDAEGRNLFGIELVRNVTTRNQVERALAGSERNYRLLFERNMAGVYRTSVSGKILECNDAFLHITECASLAEAQQMGAVSLYWSPAERQAVVAQMEREGSVSNHRLQLRSFKGRPITVLLNAHFVSEGPDAPYMEGTLIDITELESATEALAEQERRMKEIVEHSTNLFYTHGTDHVLTYVSPQSRRFFDCEPEEARVRWTELVTDHPLNAKGFEATVRAIETGVAQPPYELELKTVTGRKLWVEVNEAPVVREGRTVAIVGALTDITGKKQAEEAAAKLQGSLQQAHKMESLGVLAGGLAHDFNNLLVGVMGNAELVLMDERLPAPVRDRLEDIRMAAIRASELTGHMLSFAGQGVLAARAVDLNAVVEEMAVLMEASVSRRTFLRYNFAGGLPALEGDPVQLRQVVMNLILNASQALGEQGGLIQLGTAAVELRERDLGEMLLGTERVPGTYLCLSVSDTGCGIPPEVLPRIFDPFFGTKPGCRGLGLAVALGIVKRHGGVVHVISEVGRGSRFEVYLPALSGAVAAAPEREEEGDPSAFRGEGAVLLVDADLLVREVAASMLGGLGYRVVPAADGAAALAAASDSALGLSAVLIDLTLGAGLTGEAVVRGIRERRPGLPVVLLTGGAPAEVEQRTRELGLSGVLRKPFRRSDLVRALRNATVTSPGV